MSQITNIFDGTILPDIETLTGNAGGAVGPTGGNINIVGDGTTIDITGNPGTSTLTVSVIGSAFTWSKITADQAFTVNNGFICNKAGLLTLTLPATSAVGDIFEVTGINTDVGWRVAQNAGQSINLGNTPTAVGVGGYLESTNKFDTVRLVIVVADTTFNVISSIGNITVA